jgi:4-hydroxy-tetrahydrodipicolinate synthase
MKYDELRDKIRGVVVPLITPFKSNQEIDEDGLRKLTRYLIDNGVTTGYGTLIVTGSSGECPMLTDEERKREFEIVKDEAKNDVPILGGCNHTDPRTVIKLAKYAEEAGLDGLMISPPYYWKPSEEMILAHYETIVKGTKMGIMVYNNWFASQVDIPVETMVKLVKEIPQIVAIKDNSIVLSKLARMVKTLGDRITVLNGSGEPHEPYAALMGAKGYVTAEACLIPRTCVDIYKAELKGDYKKALDILDKASTLLDFLLGGENGTDYLVRIKAGMNLVGLPGGITRLPIPPADDNIKGQLRKILDKYPLPESWVGKKI